MKRTRSHEVLYDWDPVSKSHVPSTGTRTRFIKGPLNYGWMSKAALLSSGNALHVALAVWYLSGIHKASRVRLAPSVMKDFCSSRQAAYRGLEALERAGLVIVERHQGRSPMVTLLNADHAVVG